MNPGATRSFGSGARSTRLIVLGARAILLEATGSAQAQSCAMPGSPIPCGNPARIDPPNPPPPSVDPLAAVIFCANAAEAQPVQSAITGQILAGFNPNDPTYGMVQGQHDTSDFNYSFDTLGQAWNPNAIDPFPTVAGVLPPSDLVLPLTPFFACPLSGCPLVDFAIWGGDPQAFTNGGSGVDTILGLGQVDVFAGATSQAASAITWTPLIPFPFPGAAAFPLLASPNLTPLHDFYAPSDPAFPSADFVDGPKAAFDEGYQDVAISESIDSPPDAFETILSIYGDSTRGLPCRAQPGSPGCPLVRRINVAPLNPFGPATPSIAPFTGQGSRLDCNWATHAPAIAFNNHVWDLFMGRTSTYACCPGVDAGCTMASEGDVNHSVITLAGINNTTGQVAFYPLYSPFTAILTDTSGSLTAGAACPSGSYSWNTCLPGCERGNEIRLAQIPALAFGTDTAAGPNQFLLYVAWTAQEEPATAKGLLCTPPGGFGTFPTCPTERVFEVTYGLDESGPWPWTLRPINASVFGGDTFDSYMPAIAAQPGSAKAAVFFYRDDGFSGTTSACDAAVAACVTSDGGGRSSSLVLPPGDFHCEPLSGAIQIRRRQTSPFTETGIFTDYLGATSLGSGGRLLATWAQPVLDAASCPASFVPPGGGATISTDLTGYAIQGWSNWVDPPASAESCGDRDAEGHERCRSEEARCEESADDGERDLCPDAAVDAGSGRDSGEDAEACEALRAACDEETDKDEESCEGELHERERELAKLPPAPASIAPAMVVALPPPLVTGPAPAPMTLGAGCSTDAACDSAHGLTCNNGACGCATSRLLCGSSCVDLTSDASHCGACGISCPIAEVCHDGSCGP